MDIFFPKVYVCSVKTFSERIDHVTAVLGNLDIAFDFVFAYDPADIKEEDIATMFAPSDLTKAQQSLVLKNVHIWRECVACHHQQAVIFEDDILLRPDFTTRFMEVMQAMRDLSPGWVVFLGGLDSKVPNSYFLHTGPLVEMPIATTEGCLHDVEAMRRRLEWLKYNRVTLPVDHLMRQIDGEQGIRQFWMRHPVVEQGSITGIFGSYLDKNRQGRSYLYNMISSRWNRLRRHQVKEWLFGTLVRLAGRKSMIRLLQIFATVSKGLRKIR